MSFFENHDLELIGHRTVMI